jgi:hypothetical protein
MTELIRLVKLKNGDNLITKIEVGEEKEYATLREPVMIHKWMQQDEEHGGAFENATFGPWESFSGNQVFQIAKSEILCLTIPREDVIIYYNRLIKRLSEHAPESMIDDDIDDASTVRLKKLKKMVDELNISVEPGDNKELNEEIEEYLYNSDKIIKH